MEQSLQAALKRFGDGDELRAYTYMGCHKAERDGVSGYVFRVWAPNAASVSVVGDWNFWNPEDLPMTLLRGGVWEAFSVYAKEEQSYKYCIRTANGEKLLKTDPYSFRAQTMPETSGLICTLEEYLWGDTAYRRQQGKRRLLDSPMNVYEVHLGSWRRKEDGNYYDYEELAELLIPYVKDMGYTHIELMPISEYPYDPSWGYQVTGYYAPTSRYGEPRQLMRFVDLCHQAGIGVILDWVPAHFPKDEHGLCEFDGSCCYELSDPMMNEHPEWTTRIFDLGRGEVQSFLISNAVYWLELYHFDGIRVDAVASMLYLDYGRQEFRPNRFGGKENLEAIAFLRKLNRALFSVRRNTLSAAEESTAFPLVTRPDYDGGLGFLYKWNMGWMHDVLDYMSQDPLFRKGCHNKLTFSMTYAYSENFILPLSHDEVVHGKRSLINKMPGEYDDKFSNLRLLYGFMMAHPGKKLSFMGNEFAQFIEWRFDSELDWLLLDYERHRQMQSFVRDLNHFYLAHSSLWSNDTDWGGFEWITVDDCDHNVLSFRRIDRRGRELLCIFNFCPVKWENYSMGLPKAGRYEPLLSSDDVIYGGSGTELPVVTAHKIPLHGQPYSGEFTLAPLSVAFYKRIVPPRKSKNDKEK